MNADVKKAVDDATAEIMEAVEIVNRITCEKFKATVLLFNSISSSGAISSEDLETFKLVGMYAVLHQAKHDCEKVASTAAARAFIIRGCPR